MRLIPKSSKVSTSIWKNFTLIDLIILFGFFILECLVLASNIPYNWVIAVIILVVGIILFMESAGERAYKDIGYIVRYLVVPKTFSKEQGGRKSIDTLIPYKEIKADGTIAFNEGYFAKVIEVQPVEFGLMSGFEQNFKISNLAKAINNLSDTQEMQLIKLDRPINYDVMIERLETKIEQSSDEKERELLSVRLNQLNNLNATDKTYKPFYYFVIYDTSEATLNSTCRAFIEQLEQAVELQSNFLSAPDTAVFLKYNYYRDFDEREVKKIDKDKYIDFIKPSKVDFSWLGYNIDGKEAFTFAIADYPLTVGNAWGSRLFDIPNTKVCLHIKGVDSAQAIKRIDRAYIEVATKEGRNKASQIINDEVHIETMGELLKSLQMDSERLFDCTLTITGYNNDGGKLETLRKKVRQHVQAQGFTPNPLRCRQLDGFITANVSRRATLKNFERGINTESLSAIFPFSQSILVEKNGYTLGASGNVPVILDFWKRGGRFTNSNLSIIGQSGGGKSFFMKYLITLLYSEKSKIYVLDPENEYVKLCKSLDGNFIDVGNSEKGIINPFHIYDVLTESGDRAEPNVVYSAHLRFLDGFLKTILEGIHPDTLELINNLIVEVYKEKKITPETDVKGWKADKFPTFDDLLALIKKREKAVSTALEKEHLGRAEQYLKKFGSGGRFSNLWNGYSSLSSDNKFTVFNFQNLFATKNVEVARAQMLLITKYLSQEIINVRELNRNRRDDDLLHPVLFFDEGYQFIDEKNTIALDFIYEQYKKIRKYGGMCGFITQNISDFNREGIADKTTAILKNSQYSFIFPLKEGDVKDLVELYSGATELNEVEQYEIANNGRGRAFLINHAKSRLCFDVIAPDVIVELFDDQTGA